MVLSCSSTTDMLYDNQKNVEPFCLRLLYVKCESCFILYLCLHIYKLKNDIVVIQSLRCVQLFATTWTAACQASFSFTISQICSNLCPLSQWCHPATSPCVTFVRMRTSWLQSYPASGPFPKCQLLASGSQSIGASASASVLPMNIKDWFPLGWTGWISLQSKGLSRVFSSNTIWKHQFYGALLSLWSNPHICTWLLEKPSL